MLEGAEEDKGYNISGGEEIIENCPVGEFEINGDGENAINKYKMKAER